MKLFSHIHSNVQARRFWIYAAPALMSLAVCCTLNAGDIQGARVVNGSANIQRNGAETAIRASNNAIIEYQRFNIAANQSVRFIQPGASSRVLNRIIGASPSTLNGQLSANGIVYFVNPAGIFFGQNSVINVGQLYAAAGHISNQDFLNRVDRFIGTGIVENNGQLITADGALLFGRHVINTGTITASRGLVSLVSGEEMYLAESGSRVMVRVDNLQADAESRPPANPDASSTNGVDNSGSVAADEVVFASGDVYSLALSNRGSVKAGTIRLAGAGKVSNTGSLDASNSSGDGGRVALAGTEVILNGGSITASGSGAGGIIDVYANSLSADTFLSAAGGSGPDGRILLDPAITTVQTNAGADVVTVQTVIDGLNGGDFTIQADDTININDAIDTSAQGNSNTLNLNDENTNSVLIINLNAEITLGNSQTLAGQGSIVNVAAGTTFQNGIDVAASGATVNVAAGLFSTSGASGPFNAPVFIGTPLTLIGAGNDATTGTRLSPQGSGGQATFVSIHVTADDVTIRDIFIDGHEGLDPVTGQTIFRLLFVSGDRFSLNDVTFQNIGVNVSNSGGGGLELNGADDAVLQDVTIIGRGGASPQRFGVGGPTIQPNTGLRIVASNNTQVTNLSVDDIENAAVTAFVGAPGGASAIFDGVTISNAGTGFQINTETFNFSQEEFPGQDQTVDLRGNINLTNVTNGFSLEDTTNQDDGGQNIPDINLVITQNPTVTFTNVTTPVTRRGEGSVPNVNTFATGVGLDAVATGLDPNNQPQQQDFFSDTDDALTAAGNSGNAATATVQQISTGEFFVGNGLTIQNAANAADAGDNTVNVAAGTFNENLNVPASVPLNFDGTSTIDSLISSTGSPVTSDGGLTITGDATLGNDITTDGPLNIGGDVTLNNSVTFDTTGAGQSATGDTITVTGSVNPAADGVQGLTINSGTSDATFNGEVGDQGALSNLTITSSGEATFNGTVTANAIDSSGADSTVFLPGDTGGGGGGGGTDNGAGTIDQTGTDTTGASDTVTVQEVPNEQRPEGVGNDLSASEQIDTAAQTEGTIAAADVVESNISDSVAGSTEAQLPLSMILAGQTDGSRDFIQSPAARRLDAAFESFAAGQLASLQQDLGQELTRFRGTAAANTDLTANAGEFANQLRQADASIQDGMKQLLSLLELAGAAAKSLELDSDSAIDAVLERTKPSGLSTAEFKAIIKAYRGE